MKDPRNIHAHTHSMMVEQIMALIGRGSSNPRQYRRTLESFEIETLRRTLVELTEPESRLEIGAPTFPDHASGTDFPVPSLTETAGVIASTDTGHAPGSARETLVINVELVTMEWHCIDCHSNFPGPTDHCPKNGCPRCGSQNIFDVNVAPLGANKAVLS